MQDFLFYLNLGWEHIISLDALDHQLFVLALIAFILTATGKNSDSGNCIYHRTFYHTGFEHSGRFPGSFRLGRIFNSAYDCSDLSG